MSNLATVNQHEQNMTSTTKSSPLPSPFTTKYAEIGKQTNGGDTTSTDNIPPNRHGLSELSKQLRVLQAKNQAYCNEVDKLERQLSILAVLKGVSTAELRDALTDACKGAAHADLQNQVGYLRARLDAVALGDEFAVTDFEKSVSSKTIATLQLRVGEGEEVEDKLRTEITSLYQQLNEQASKSTRLESTCDQQKKHLEEREDLTNKCKEQAEVLEEEVKSSKAEIECLTTYAQETSLELQVLKDRVKEQKTRQVASVGKLAQAEDTLRGELSNAYHSLSEQTSKAIRLECSCSQHDKKLGEMAERAKKYINKITSLRAARDDAQTEITSLKRHLQETEVELRVKNDRSNVLEGQVEARESESQLRSDQFKSRFTVQDERIYDLEQQLSSLYVAFEILRQERNTEKEMRLALGENLNAADHQVAHQIYTEEGGQRKDPQVTPQKLEPSPSAPVMTRSAMPQAYPPIRESIPLRQPPVSPATPITPTIQKLAAGYLWKRDKSILKGWKQRFFVLFGKDGNFHICYSDAPKEKVKGVIEITAGVSSVTQTKEFSNKPYAFVLRVNPQDLHSPPELYAAANTNEDLLKWLSVLRVATTGHDVKNQSRTNKKNRRESDHEMAMRLQLEFNS